MSASDKPFYQTIFDNFMGISTIQHRVVTGCYTPNISPKRMKPKLFYDKYTRFSRVADRVTLDGSLMVLLTIFYLCILNLMMAVCWDMSTSGLDHASRSGSNFMPKDHYGASLRGYLGICCLFLLKQCTLIIYQGYKRRRRGASFSWQKLLRVVTQFTWGLLFLKILLVVISNTSLLNPGPDNNFSVMYQNVRGFVPFSSLGSSHPQLDTTKLLEFQSHVYEHEPDLIVLNETWLSKTHLDSEILDNASYKIFRLDRTLKSHPMDPNHPTKYKKHGGGVLIAVRTTADVESKVVTTKCGAEILSVELKFSPHNVICISSLYRVGTLGEENRAEVHRYLAKMALMKKFNKHILIGDLNLSGTSWPEGETSSNLEQGFLDLFNDLGLEQQIEKPTHIKGRVLDLLLTNSPSLIRDVSILGHNDVCSSDHFCITFNIKVRVKRKKVTKRKIYNYKRADFKGLNSELKHIPWDSVLAGCDPGTGWVKFKGILLNLCNKYIPTVTVRDKLQPPWFDSETFQLCREKERLRAKFKLSQSASDYSKYAKKRKEFKNLVQEKMAANFSDDSDPAIVSKKFWGHLKASTKTSRIPETIGYNGRFRNNPQDQSELFNTYFADQFSAPSSYNIEVDFSQESDNIGFEISHSAVRKLLKKIDPNKAAGPDEINGRVLKMCAEGICYPLSKIFLQSYNTGLIPNEWKQANVVPVHKKGSKTSSENYRPISLTCLVMKVFEKIVRDELMSRCGHLITDLQHGFLPMKSCSTQLIPFCDELSRSINDKCRTDVVYFDFAKAFDSVNHDIILAKLKNKFNIDGKLLRFLINYLKDRKQCVVVGGCKSGLRPVASGVPQGSILGPLLFVLFINDMADEVSEDTSLLLYADDTKIWRRIVDWFDHLQLQQDILSLYKWSRDNLMNFHPDKCKVLSVSFLREVHHLPFMSFFYTLDGTDGTELEYIQSEKDLGIVISGRLSWTAQIDALYSKASSRLGLVKRACHFVNVEKQRRVLYLSLVRSIFDHGSVIWHPSPNQVSRLENIQRRGVKWIAGELDHHFNSNEYLSRLWDLDILPISCRLVLVDLLMFFDILKGTTCVTLPDYIARIQPDDIEMTRLRSCHLDLDCFKCTIEIECLTFQSNFFNRCISSWNNLPRNVRLIKERPAFKSAVTAHLWNEELVAKSNEEDGSVSE